MNIFVLHEDPEISALMLCDKHVVKMPLETAQLLCSPFDNGTAPYRQTHYNHPCSKWARTSLQNYEWLLTYADYLFSEYRARYDRGHASWEAVGWCLVNYEALELPSIGMTPFAVCVPEELRVEGDVVESYRNYYLHRKAYMARWNKGRPPPQWWNPPPEALGKEPKRR